MIFDCFLFFQEIDILLIRLDYLYDLVDKFIIVEAAESFTGKKKEFIFEKNIKLFEKYIDKIHYHKIDDRHKNYKSITEFLINKNEMIYSKIKFFMHNHDYYDKEKIHYILDSYHRECIHIPLSKICNDDDLIILSDLDEIPNRKIIKNIRDIKKPLVCKQNEFKYFLNLYSNNNWLGSTILKYTDLKATSLNIIRRESNKFNIVFPGGYHFTSIGKEKDIINKIENWGHQEFNQKIIKKNLMKNIKTGRDIFYRFGQGKNKIVSFDNRKIYDQEIVQIINNFQNLKLNTNKMETTFDWIEYKLIQLIIYFKRFLKQPIYGLKKMLKIIRNK